ncbi:unnamed protein product, partial [Polarella glacialis]
RWRWSGRRVAATSVLLLSRSVAALRASARRRRRVQRRAHAGDQRPQTPESVSRRQGFVTVASRGLAAGAPLMAHQPLAVAEGLAAAGVAEDWRRFPASFQWGVATSAFQVEGSPSAGGKGPSIWDSFSHIKGNISDNSTADVACDDLARYKEDVELVHSLGAKAYRFSLSWSRILPTGTAAGGISEEGLAFYEALCQEVRARGLEPVVTLYHWDLPQALEDRGGWLNRATVDAFDEYAEVCFNRLGKYVRTWCSINEPWTQCVLGYCFGAHAPGRSIAPGEEPYLAGHNMLLAHAAAAQAYRKVRPAEGRLAMVLNTEWYEAQEPGNSADRVAVERALAFNLGWFAEPLYKGDYPPVMRQPQFSAEERQALQGSNDFFALNCYSARYVCEDTPWRNLQNLPATLRTLPYIADVVVAKFKAAVAEAEAKKLAEAEAQKSNNNNSSINNSSSSNATIDSGINNNAASNGNNHARSNSSNSTNNNNSNATSKATNNANGNSTSSAQSSRILTGGPATPPGGVPPSSSWISDKGYETAVPLDAELTATGWPVAHYGLGRLLLHVQKTFKPPGGIVVTEAGAAFSADSKGSAEQASYLEAQAVVLRKAMVEGADVRGYFWWTLMDNFEWSYGYTKHFGLFAVDFDGSLARTERPAARTFQQLAKRNSVAESVSEAQFAASLERPDGR